MSSLILQDLCSRDLATRSLSPSSSAGSGVMLSPSSTQPLLNSPDPLRKTFVRNHKRRRNCLALDWFLHFKEAVGLAASKRNLCLNFAFDFPALDRPFYLCGHSLLSKWEEGAPASREYQLLLVIQLPTYTDKKFIIPIWPVKLISRVYKSYCKGPCDRI